MTDRTTIGLVLIALLGIQPPFAAAVYSGGDGSPEAPYRIAAAEDLNDTIRIMDRGRRTRQESNRGEE
ncbi:MAG: hypothetical protein ACYTEQ_26475 [Planctomycetota bacterium]